MRGLRHILWLFLLFLAICSSHAQVETKRWWNVGATTDTDRAVFCADIEATPLEELLQNLKTAPDETARLQLYLRIVRSYQDKTIIFRAIVYADSALSLATKLKDSISICRVHVASVYNMDMCGNPGGMLQEAKLAQANMPRSVKGTMEEYKVHVVTGDAYYALFQYDEAERSYKTAKDIINILGNGKCAGYTDMNLGRIMQASGKLDKAIEAYQESASIFESLQDTLTCCVLYSQIASAYSSLGMRDQQLKYLYQTLELSKHLDNPIHQAAIYRDIGFFYRSLGDSILTADFYNMAIEAYQEVPHAFSPELGDSYNDMADFYHYLGDEAKALDYQRRSIQSYRMYPRPVTLMNYKMGYLYQAFGNLDSAYYYYNDAYKRSLALNDPRLSATCAKGFANYYTQTKDIKKAIQFAEISYANAQKIRWIEMIRELSGLLSELYAENRDFQKAYNSQMEFRQLSDSLETTKNMREVARLSAQIEFADREARMNMQIATQQRQIRMQWGLSILLICVLVLVSVLVVVTLKNNKQRKRVNRQLSEQTEELTSFNEELTATNEELMTVNDELQKTYEELDHYKNDLENMVNEKTAELQLAFTQVQESDRFKAAFFANMSHEIRTPLNAILGFLQFIGKPEISTQQQDQMITLINSNASQLLSLVDDIVDLSKIDSGLLVIRPDQFMIKQLLDEVYDDAQQIIRYANKPQLALVSENRLPPALDSFLIDGKRIRQVFVHLLDNAVKFTETGYILFGCEISENWQYLHFFVEDTGIGIPPEHKTEIFKRFWKQGEVYTQRYRGVGIGLSLCESLVTLMGGAFSVESIPGQGSTLRFSIRIAKEMD